MFLVPVWLCLQTVLEWKSHCRSSFSDFSFVRFEGNLDVVLDLLWFPLAFGHQSYIKGLV